MKKMLCIFVTLVVFMVFLSVAGAQEKTAPVKAQGTQDVGAAGKTEGFPKVAPSKAAGKTEGFPKVAPSKAAVKTEASQKVAPSKAGGEGFPKVDAAGKMESPKVNAPVKLKQQTTTSTPEAPSPPKK